jgi:hypothetical protein
MMGMVDFLEIISDVNRKSIKTDFKKASRHTLQATAKLHRVALAWMFASSVKRSATKRGIKELRRSVT